MVNSYTSQGIDYKYHELKYKGSLYLQMFTSTIEVGIRSKYQVFQEVQ